MNLNDEYLILYNKFSKVIDDHLAKSWKSQITAEEQKYGNLRHFIAFYH